MKGDINTDDDARCFLEGVNASTTLKTLMYILLLKPFSTDFVHRLLTCTDRTEEQSFFSELLATSAEIIDLRLIFSVHKRLNYAVYVVLFLDFKRAKVELTYTKQLWRRFCPRILVFS